MKKYAGRFAKTKRVSCKYNKNMRRRMPLPSPAATACSRQRRQGALHTALCFAMFRRLNPHRGVEGRSPPKDIRTRDGGRRFLKAGALRARAGVIVREKAA